MIKLAVPVAAKQSALYTTMSHNDKSLLQSIHESSLVIVVYNNIVSSHGTGLNLISHLNT